MFTRMICLSGGAAAALLPPELLLPHAAAATNPTLARANARTRKPNCIRVLPLRLILRPSSRQPYPGRECAGQQVLLTASTANLNSVGTRRQVSSCIGRY